MPKEPKAPTVTERLAVVEALIAREEREASGADPLALTPQSPASDKIVQEGEAGDMRQALARPEVRRVFYRIFKLGGLLESDSDPNPTIMAHHAGRRSLALDLYNAIKKVDPGVYWQMEREHASDLKSKEIANAE